ncbi:hypothetical protein [Aquipuribacter hungaricus]|uniref:Uncharacterized protein n=1 Tax=Aquipuribacter hungaricus TaxID=545624 RepID=A0ABV7WJA3_9MICO
MPAAAPTPAPGAARPATARETARETDGADDGLQVRSQGRVDGLRVLQRGADGRTGADGHEAADVLAATRTALHAVVELVMAGPQQRASGTVDLAVRPGALETVAAPRLRLEATSLAGQGGEASLLGTTSVLALAAAVGVTAGAPGGSRGGTTGIGLDDPLQVDTDLATALLDWFAVGAAALLTVAPGEQAVLRPDDLRLSVTVDGVVCGVSPGDGTSVHPYAFVVPAGAGAGHAHQQTWSQVPDAGSVAAFFADGRARVLAGSTGSPGGRTAVDGGGAPPASR